MGESNTVVSAYTLLGESNTVVGAYTLLAECNTVVSAYTRWPSAMRLKVPLHYWVRAILL